ncbi:MAG: hypothetical protein SFY80_08500 [Verrucomicrobiota bacterium]|nr:hypothetical protein [Verrucomicrobiota bacterium]
MSLPYTTIRKALDVQPLFEDKTWRLSPNAFPITAAQLAEIKAIGRACLEFYKACEQLYLRSVAGKNLFRNREYKAPWVAAYLDRGKPEALIAHARSKRLRGSLPAVIRPDLLMTDDGFAVTEIDSVPGGIGLTAFLNRLYANQPGIIGSGDRMIQAFYEVLAAQAPTHKALPLIAILVSDEAATYRPEMEWLAGELRARGKRVYCLHPREVIPLGSTLNIDLGGNPEQVDLVYRFWELFDMANVPVAEWILEAWEQSELVVSPPMRPFQEEKLNLALFHHHLLEDFWKENLSTEALGVLRRVIPKSWIMDPVDLPPNAVLDAPPVAGKPIVTWDQLGEASQKERNLIIKISGFHESAWGARSVTYGGDASRTEWMMAIRRAMQQSSYNLSVLQDYKKPRRLTHPVYLVDHSKPTQGIAPQVAPMEGRMRLCPYYFVKGNDAELTGILATFCPADKKIIHGMKDAAMLPCQLV